MKEKFINPFMLSSMLALGLARGTALTWWGAMNFNFVILALSIYAGLTPQLNMEVLLNVVVVFNIISIPFSWLLKGKRCAVSDAFAGSKAYLWLTRGLGGWGWWTLSVVVLVVLVCNAASMWVYSKSLWVYSFGYTLLLMGAVGLALLSLWQSAKVLYCWWLIGIRAQLGGFFVSNPGSAKKYKWAEPKPIPFMALVAVLLMVVALAMLTEKSQSLFGTVLPTAVLITYCLGIWVFSEKLFKSVASNLSLIYERTELSKELEQRKRDAKVVLRG